MTLREICDPEAMSELAEELRGQPIPNLRMTEQEFVEWCDEDVKAEWIDGEVILMAPVSGGHSDDNVWLLRLAALFVEHFELGIVRGPEFQVRLAPRRRRRTPDVMFVSNARLKLLRPNHLEGAPDLIMEIVSPDSESRDRRDKYLDYEAAGVREYWIVDPLTQTVEAYSLGRSKKYRLIREIDGKINSKVLRGFYIRPAWLWKSPLPKISQIARELGVR